MDRTGGTELIHLDAVRGLAALAVFAGHLRALTLIPAASLPNLGIGHTAFYFATGLGAESVLVFFVLSGFFITRSIDQKYRSGRWDARQYALFRLTRLWVVLIPALLLTAMWDVAGRALTASPIYYGAAPVPVLADPQSLDLVTLIGNVFFLQTIATTTYGSNGPLWSLANEFWYYFMFPLLYFAFALRGRSRSWLLLPLALVVAAQLPPGLIIGFAVWLLGALAFFASRSARVMRWAAAAPMRALSILLLFSGLAATKALDLTEVGRSVIVGGSAALLVLCLARPRAHARSSYAAGARALASMSYTLYLVHLPLCVFLYATLVRGQLLAPGPVGYARYAIGFLLVLAYAALMYWLFEGRTESVRRWVQQSGQRSRVAPNPLP